MDLNKLKELYYVICKPQEQNKNTHNFCISVNPNSYLTKDFLFYQEINGKEYCKFISRFYVKEHAQKFVYTKTDEETKESKTMYFFYITLNDIFDAPHLKNVK